MKHQLCQGSWPKNIHRLWPWWAPPHHNPPAITGKRKELRENCESLKESLFAGELSDGRSPMQVPKGFLAVYAGPEFRRFVIPTSYLSMPDFRILMDRAAEEFGYAQEGGIRIPCEEKDFENILLTCWANDRKKNKKKV